jgi:hypothetical protein
MPNTDAFDLCRQNIKPHVPGGDEESDEVKSEQNTSAPEGYQHSASRSGLALNHTPAIHVVWRIAEGFRKESNQTMRKHVQDACSAKQELLMHQGLWTFKDSSFLWINF